MQGRASPACCYVHVCFFTLDESYLPLVGARLQAHSFLQWKHHIGQQLVLFRNMSSFFIPSKFQIWNLSIYLASFTIILIDLIGFTKRHSKSLPRSLHAEIKRKGMEIWDTKDSTPPFSPHKSRQWKGDFHYCLLVKTRPRTGAIPN